MTSKILICGAGAIGIFIGAKLYSRGHHVYMVGRRKLKAVNNDKVLINNKSYNMPIKRYSFPKNESYDFIFITSKLYDLDKIVNIIYKNKINGRIIAFIQNGLMDYSKFERKLNNRIIPICIFGGFMIEKNKIFNNPTQAGWKTEFSKQGKEISRLLSNCGIQCKPAKNFNSLRLEKMIINCCLNALSAIKKKQFNVLFSEKNNLKRIYKIFDECYQVLNKKYDLDEINKMKKNMFNNWHNVKHYSSTYQDIVSGRKSEIDFLNGYIIKLVKKYKINAKENLNVIKNFEMVKNGV